MSARIGICFVVLLTACTSGIAQERGLAQADFEQLHCLLQPTKQEPWQTVPWKLSILEAQAQAVKEKKPIFMLVRSGHPLGCV
jgi:hypothetical protein